MRIAGNSLVVVKGLAEQDRLVQRVEAGVMNHFVHVR